MLVSVNMIALYRTVRKLAATPCWRLTVHEATPVPAVTLNWWLGAEASFSNEVARWPRSTTVQRFSGSKSLWYFSGFAAAPLASLLLGGVLLATLGLSGLPK